MQADSKKAVLNQPVSKQLVSGSRFLLLAFTGILALLCLPAFFQTEPFLAASSQSASLQDPSTRTPSSQTDPSQTDSSQTDSSQDASHELYASSRTPDPGRKPDSQPAPSDNPKGVIRFVFGSDSSTPGIHLYTKTANYANANFDLFRSPTRQTFRIMEPAFRERYRDSSGQPFRFTWWMQGGSLYRYATNTNIPYPSLMSLYLMNKYHSENMERYGDEFTYHYHTWVWSDATGDGIYYWNQTPQYIDSREDFFLNMAEALIEEDMFTVSFRSGWHFMDNDWQADLDDWIPFSLHNAWPANRTESPEPVNNLYVWNEAPSDWVPFRPRSDNYMLPGGNRGWNTRSIHFRSVRESTIREIFEAASQGVDQVPCIWSHVAEATFIEDLERVFELIEMVAAEYPDIEFYYDTAIEAMQGWLQTDDTTPPVLTVDEVAEGDGYRIRVQSDKPLFMSRPFLAAKDIYEQHRRVEMTQTGPLTWDSDEILTPQNAASWSVAATDSAGNLAKYHRDWLPRILWLDDESDGFSTTGNWRAADYREIDAAWGAQAHVAEASTDPASARWTATIPEAARNSEATRNSEAVHYDVQIRFPSGLEISGAIPFTVYLNEAEVQTGLLENIAYDRWIYLHDLEVGSGDRLAVEIRRNENGPPTALTADAIRITAYRPPVFLSVSDEIPDLGFMERGDSRYFSIALENRGFETAEITHMESRMGYIQFESALPVSVAGRSQRDLRFRFQADEYGILRDTLVLYSDGPADRASKSATGHNQTHASGHTNNFGNQVFVIPVQAYGKGPFQLVDNEDSEQYEESGPWNYSVAQAYGSSSRWVMISAANREAFARYHFTIGTSGRYALSYIIPAAENSALRARYDVRLNNEVILERIVDQNIERAAWRWLGSFEASSGDNLTITVSLPDTDQPGRVLRADAMQIEQLAGNRHQLIMDNESQDYSETGEWFTSNSQAWGTSSRYASSPDAQAAWLVRDVNAGLAELEVLLPKTENAVTSARYRMYRDQRLLGVSTINQNEGSGNWVPVAVFPVDMAGDISVTVDVPEQSAMDGVLRADAIRLTYSRDASETHSPISDELPRTNRLHQNYPNPFNPVTTIRFELADGAQQVRIAVFDALGRRVAVLLNGELPAGTHTVPFDGSALASGLYLYRLETENGVLNRKMMLVK